jgi:hypothetical protein
MPARTSNDFGLIISSIADGTQPASTIGTAVTPGTSNSYGSYATVLSGASLTQDCYLLEVIIGTAFTNATDRGMLVTIGFDPAGGTSFSGLGGVAGNEIADLLCSGATVMFTAAGGGHRFLFPVSVPAGTSIGARAQASNGTAGTVRVAVNCYCLPSRPDLVRAGSFVRTFGVNTGTTDGVSVTQGTASEGSWTEIGTAADPLWYLETGLSARSATLNADASVTDVAIGDASNKKLMIRDIVLFTATQESTTKNGWSGDFVNIASGDKIYARSQASAAQPGFSVACYGVGG